MLDFTKLWNKTYLLGPNPFDFSRSDRAFFALAAAFIALSVIVFFLRRRADHGSPQNYLLSRIFHLFFTMGIFLLIWVGARFENAPGLSLHIFPLFLLLIFIIWAGAIGRYYFTRHRPAVKVWEEEKLKAKYLSRSK